MWGCKSELGVATLIIFIALLLVTAIVAVVIITSQGAQEEKSLSTATSARREVTTQIGLYDLSATDGRNGELDYFSYKIRLKPGAEAISLEDVVLIVNTYNDTLRLLYREGACRRDVTDGYYTIR